MTTPPPTLLASLVELFRSLDRDEACLLGTPMVPIHRDTLRQAATALEALAADVLQSTKNLMIVARQRNDANEQIAALEAMNAELVEVVQECAAAMALVTEGNPMGVGKNEKCGHGRYGFEGCESCADNALDVALTCARAILNGAPQP